MKFKGTTYDGRIVIGNGVFADPERAWILVSHGHGYQQHRVLPGSLQYETDIHDRCGEKLFSGDNITLFDDSGHTHQLTVRQHECVECMEARGYIIGSIERI